MGERWSTWWERAGRLVLTTVALLGRRVEGRTAGGREQDCWVGEGRTAGRDKVGLLGGREVDDLVGEGWAAGQERD